MRVLFVPAAMRPHFYPLVTLAWAFRAAGHDVRVAGQPSIVEQIARSGLPAVCVGAEHDLLQNMREIFQNPAVDLAAVRRRMSRVATGGRSPKWDRAALRELTPEEERLREQVTYRPHTMAAEAMAADLVPFAREWGPDLVVSDPLPYVSSLVAEVLQVPLVRHLWGPNSTRRLAGHGGPTDRTAADAWPTELVALFEKYGARVRDDHARLTVDPTPTRMQIDDIPHRLPVRYVPYNGSGTVPGWLTEPAGRPRVCVTWGTTTAALTSREKYVVPTILEELLELDVEVVATLNREEREKLGELDERVRLVENLPLDWLLPTCHAIVHQAGAGTMLTAAAHGVPQVAVPQATDQPFNAAMLRGTGAGLTVDVDGFRDGDIRRTVAAAMNDVSVRESARRLREEVREQPSPAEVVATLEKLV
ncbi:nucleotide disphospho-sugar-binding domain-containing protein [Streptomyces malaysiense]|uniref:Uncharacterized protein n=1 Tax=Streptomyces malaysiense TaxID=1428626 RepID=A0A1J4PWX0_9ACTN|nr:nucleotide disphospho-sugar-binding domain-containing protein [Streptomyces malaysiense]OIK25435.1 hypothetical protein VT52_021410 [Streptomyces malaysiense]